MQKYRRKENPDFVVEAVQLTKANVREVAEWCIGKEIEETDAMDSSIKYVGLNLLTVVEGIRRASEGDFVVQDVIGGFHVRWPDNFLRDFEEVNDGE
jgi:hypothetical protein